MGVIVIVGYQPKPGKSEALRQLLEAHVTRLRAEGLATSREPILMQSKSGTFVEVFEWVSEAAIAEAHQNAVVQTMWDEYAAVCDYVPVGSLDEAQPLFSAFTPVAYP